MKKIIKIALAMLILTLMILSTISFAILNVSALIIDSVTIVDETAPGETSKISIGLDNNGEIIEDVSIVLDLTNVPFAPFNSASEYGFDEIEEDKRKSAEFEIITLNNAKAGIYKIPLIITYKENDKLITKNSLISIVVNSKPIIDVNIDAWFLKGKENEVLIKVTNKGLSDAKFVEIEVNSGNFNLLSSKKHYIGDIESDDFDSVKINVFFNEKVSDNVNLPLTVSYKDDLNKVYTENFNIPVSVYTENSAVELGLIEKNNIPTYIVGLVSVIILYLVYRSLRKRARK